MSSIRYLHDPVNPANLADLKVFRLTTDPGLPSLIPLINGSDTTGRLIMIGNGMSAGAQHFWNVDKSGFPWLWQDGPAPANPPGPGPDDYSGFEVTYDDTGHRVIRWGENEVLNDNAVAQTFARLGDGTPLLAAGFTTAFDDLQYTGTTPLASESAGHGRRLGRCRVFLGPKRRAAPLGHYG